MMDLTSLTVTTNSTVLSFFFFLFYPHTLHTYTESLRLRVSKEALKHKL